MEREPHYPSKVVAPALDGSTGAVKEVIQVIQNQTCRKCGEQGQHIVAFVLKPIESYPNHVICHQGCSAHWSMREIGFLDIAGSTESE